MGKRPNEGAYRRSRQRERILQLLQGTGTHPRAHWLYDKLRDEFPDLSVGTVYRNLGILAEQGLIRRLDFGSTFDRFEANTSPHYHFVCKECGAIMDLELDVDESLNALVNRKTPHVAEQHDIQFHGTCADCLSKRK